MSLSVPHASQCVHKNLHSCGRKCQCPQSIMMSLPLRFPSTLLSFFRENLSASVQQIMNHPSPGNMLCVCTCTGSSCNFPSTFFFISMYIFFFLWTLKLLENLSQKNLAPPVPDRILLVSYVSAGSTPSQSSPSFISPPTGPETLCSPSVEHRQSCTLSLCFSVCLCPSVLHLANGLHRVSAETSVNQKLHSTAVGGIK